MERSNGNLRVDRILLEGLRSNGGRWVMGLNGGVVILFLLSPWELGEVLVAFWLEAAAVAGFCALFVALAPRSGPTLWHRFARVVVWILLAGAFLTLTGLCVSWTLEGVNSVSADGSPADVVLIVPPIRQALGATPWIAAGWLALRSAASFWEVFGAGRFQEGIGRAGGRFFVVYVPVLAVTTLLFVLSEGRYGRVFPVVFLAVLTYYELVLTLRLLPSLDDT